MSVVVGLQHTLGNVGSPANAGARRQMQRLLTMR